jgi:hypothetical protein
MGGFSRPTPSGGFPLRTQQEVRNTTGSVSAILIVDLLSEDRCQDTEKRPEVKGPEMILSVIFFADQ